MMILDALQAVKLIGPPDISISKEEPLGRAQYNLLCELMISDKQTPPPFQFESPPNKTKAVLGRLHLNNTIHWNRMLAETPLAHLMTQSCLSLVQDINTWSISPGEQETPFVLAQSDAGSYPNVYSAAIAQYIECVRDYYFCKHIRHPKKMKQECQRGFWQMSQSSPNAPYDENKLENYWQSVADADKEFVVDYTYNGYVKVNRNLLSNILLGTEASISNEVQTLRHLFAKQPKPNVKQFFVYRAARMLDLIQGVGNASTLHPGDIICNPTFTSTTYDCDFNITTSHYMNASIILRINVRAELFDDWNSLDDFGFIQPISQAKLEKEVLLCPGTAFRVIRQPITLTAVSATPKTNCVMGRKVFLDVELLPSKSIQEKDIMAAISPSKRVGGGTNKQIKACLFSDIREIRAGDEAFDEFLGPAHEGTCVAKPNTPEFIIVLAKFLNALQSSCHLFGPIAGIIKTPLLGDLQIPESFLEPSTLFGGHHISQILKSRITRTTAKQSKKQRVLDTMLHSPNLIPSAISVQAGGTGGKGKQYTKSKRREREFLAKARNK